MLGMAQVGRYWPAFRQAMQEATGELLEPAEISVDWIRMHAADLMQLMPRIDEMFASKPAREWVELFRRHDLLIEVVQEYGELAGDPQITENAMLTTLEHPAHGPLPIVAPGVNLSLTPGTIRTAGPEFGQHTEEVLLEFGLTWEEIASLRDQGVIGPRVPAASPE
jgi:crotonobetainyl-CoA:carnitine CoA-transferase CaiB-like acyl-CoA transferase